MSKSKGVVLGEHHLDPSNKTVVGPGQGLNSRGIGDAMSTNSPPRAAWDKPPMATTHVPSAVTCEERFHAEHGDTIGSLNRVDSRDGSAMGLDNRPSSAMKDTPMPTRGRQMPDTAIISKAQEVGEELRAHGSGEASRGAVRWGTADMNVQAAADGRGRGWIQRP